MTKTSSLPTTTTTTQPSSSSTAGRLTCSLSGAQCDVPVVSRHSGHVFERRVIDKALSANGNKCPHTGISLDPVNDLITVKLNSPNVVVPPPKTDVPAMLTHVINEWDARALEVQQLRNDLRQKKQTLQRTRQELASALYRLDCALRLNARASVNNDATIERDRDRDVDSTGTKMKKGRKSSEVETKKNGHDDDDGDGEHDNEHRHNGTEHPSSEQQPLSSSNAARKRRRTEHAAAPDENAAENEQEAPRNDIDNNRHVTGNNEMPKGKHEKDTGQPTRETTTNDNNPVMKNDKGITLLSKPLTTAINSLGSSLSQARKARKPPRWWPTSSELSRMRVTRRCMVVDSAAGAKRKVRPYICSLAWMPSTSDDDSSSSGSVYVGLSNGAIEQIDTKSMAIINNNRNQDQQWLSGHLDSGSAVRVVWGNNIWNSVEEGGSGSGRPLLLSGGSDGCVLTWDVNRRTRIAEWNSDIDTSSTISNRSTTNEVVGIEGHALGSLFLVGRRRSWTWYDLDYSTTATSTTNKVLSQYSLPRDCTYSYSTANIHPDGMFFALGRTDGVVDLCDVQSMSVIHTLCDSNNSNRTSRCTGVAMSEKGYYMATCCDGQVQIWDLRKRAVVGRVGGDEGNADGYVTGVALDAFGEFGCAVTAGGRRGGGVSVFAARKNAKKVGRFDFDDGNGNGEGGVENEEEGVVVGPVVTWGGRDANGAKRLWISRRRCVTEASVTAL